MRTLSAVLTTQSCVCTYLPLNQGHHSIQDCQLGPESVHYRGSTVYVTLASQCQCIASLLCSHIFLWRIYMDKESTIQHRNQSSQYIILLNPHIVAPHLYVLNTTYIQKLILYTFIVVSINLNRCTSFSNYTA